MASRGGIYRGRGGGGKTKGLIALETTGAKKDFRVVSHQKNCVGKNCVESVLILLQGEVRPGKRHHVGHSEAAEADRKWSVLTVSHFLRKEISFPFLSKF